MEKAPPQIMPLQILSGKGAVQIMPFRKLGGKFHFFLRFCTRKRSETYVISWVWFVYIKFDQRQVSVCTPALCMYVDICTTRMRSSTMRTARFSGRLYRTGVSASGSGCACTTPSSHPSFTTHNPFHSCHMWTEWLTDRCKNITFANFVCGR